MIVSVINHKGGTAKTTTSAYFALIASATQDTLVIDLDGLMCLTTFFGIAHKYNIIDSLLTGKLQTVNISDRLHICPGSKKVDRFDKLFSEMYGSELLLKEMLAEAPYPTIIIDTAPALSTATANAIFAADVLVIPYEHSQWESDGVKSVLSELEAVTKSSLRKNYAARVYILPVMAGIMDRFTPPHIEGVPILPAIPNGKPSQTLNGIKRNHIYKAYEKAWGMICTENLK